MKLLFLAIVQIMKKRGFFTRPHFPPNHNSLHCHNVEFCEKNNKEQDDLFPALVQTHFSLLF